MKRARHRSTSRRNTVIAGILAGAGLLALVGGGPAPREPAPVPVRAERRGPVRCALAWRLPAGQPLPALPHVVPLTDAERGPERTGKLELGRTLLHVDPGLAKHLRRAATGGRWTRELPGLGQLHLRFTPGGDCVATVEGTGPR